MKLNDELKVHGTPVNANNSSNISHILFHLDSLRMLSVVASYQGKFNSEVRKTGWVVSFMCSSFQPDIHPRNIDR